MKRFDANVGAIDPTLQEGPEVFESIGVDFSIDVFFCMVNHFVSVLLGQAIIGMQRIGIERTLSGNVIPHFLLKWTFAAARNNDCADLSATFKHSEHWSLILAARSGNSAFALIEMHIPRFPTDESLVHFYFTAQLAKRFVLQGKTDAVHHEPSRFLSDAKCATYFVGTDSVFAVGEHPSSSEPLIEADRRILKDSPDLDGELALRMMGRALPSAAVPVVTHALRSAGRTRNTLRPAPLREVFNAVIWIREVDDCFLKALWFAHVLALHEQKYTLKPWASQVSYCPNKLPAVYLRTRIALPGVYGRMDHYGLDTKRGILIVSALGNDTVELIDSWKRIHTITGLEHPQGSLYVPAVDRIVVSSQSGKVRFYDAGNYQLLKTLDFGDEADTDNLRYDPKEKSLYVAYGKNELSGAIAVVDPAAMERVREFKLGSKAESFQLEKLGSRMFVNLPDQESIGVIDRKTGELTKWKIPGIAKNHTLSLDEADHRLFTAALAPPGGLTVVDSESGKVVAHLPCVFGVDDLWL